MLLPKILLPQFDRTAVRGAIGGVVPRVAVAFQHRAAGDALRGQNPLERDEPVPIIGVAEVGVAGRLGAFDLFAQRRRPFAPREQPALVERHGERERLRLPRLAEHRPTLVARQARHRFRCLKRRRLDLLADHSGTSLEHDPEKWKPVPPRQVGRDHAPQTSRNVITIRKKSSRSNVTTPPRRSAGDVIVAGSGKRRAVRCRRSAGRRSWSTSSHWGARRFLFHRPMSCPARKRGGRTCSWEPLTRWPEPYLAPGPDLCT